MPPLYGTSVVSNFKVGIGPIGKRAKLALVRVCRERERWCCTCLAERGREGWKHQLKLHYKNRRCTWTELSTLRHHTNIYNISVDCFFVAVFSQSSDWSDTHKCFTGWINIHNCETFCSVIPTCMCDDTGVGNWVVHAWQHISYRMSSIYCMNVSPGTWMSDMW